MRIAAALVACLALLASGCIEDRCTLDDSVRLLFVYPESSAPPDTTNPHVFYSIQEALDAAPPPEGDGAETTVCVADGVYREQLALPPGVRLLGRGADRVRLRPPGGRDDETLVTVATDALTSAVIKDMDVGGTTAACIDASGGGVLRVVDSRLLGCGTAVRATGGGDLGGLEVAGTPIARSGTALHITSMADVSVLDTDLTGNDLVALADNRAGAGTLRFERVRLADNAAGVTVHGGAARFVGVEATEDHPLVTAAEANVVLRSVGLSVAAGPVAVVEGGTLDASHLTVLGEGPLLDVSGGGAAVVVNSILAPADSGTGDIDIRSSLTGDADAPTTGTNLPWADPELTGWVPAAGSPARCVGEPAPDDVVYLLGNPRPFREGKGPDAGAVELQEACP